MTGATVFVGMDGWVNEDIPSQVNDETRGLKLDHTTSEFKRAFLWFKLPFTPGADVDVSEATLTVRLKGAWSGTRDLEVKRILDPWSARSLKWSNAPDVGIALAATTVFTDAAGNDEVEVDISTMMAEVAAGDKEWHGLRLNVSTGGLVSIWGKEALDPAYRPKIRLVWTEEPDAPIGLSPSGGLAISKARPNLGWTVPGVRGETAQARARIEIASAADMSSVTYDSGMLTLAETEFDLADPPAGAPAVPSIADGDDRWWHVRYEDDQGRASDWSHVAKFTRRSQGTIEILNPTDGATLEDVTPEVLLDFSGGTLEALALFLDKVDDDGQSWVEVWRRPRKVSTETAITIPAGYIRRDADRYRIRARAWDDVDREARPGDPMWVQAVSEFTFDTNAAVDPVDSIVAQQHADGSPLVDIVVTTDDAPDYFCLWVDGDRQKPRIDPSDVVTGAGEYTIVYDSAPPRVNVTYKVERVQNAGGVLKHSKANPSDTYASAPTGIWLWDRDDPSAAVVLVNPGAGAEFDWGEVAGVFFPMGRYPQAPVRLQQSTRGREGPVEGTLRDRDGIKAAALLARLVRIWRSGRAMRLVMGSVNIPVVIGQPHDAPAMEEPTPAFLVSFPAWQIGEF